MPCGRQAGEQLAAFLGCMWPGPAVSSLCMCLLLSTQSHFHMCHFREVSVPSGLCKMKGLVVIPPSFVSLTTDTGTYVFVAWSSP